MDIYISNKVGHRAGAGGGSLVDHTWSVTLPVRYCSQSEHKTGGIEEDLSSGKQFEMNWSSYVENSKKDRRWLLEPKSKNNL